jgi:hypothetical protein
VPGPEQVRSAGAGAGVVDSGAGGPLSEMRKGLPDAEWSRVNNSNNNNNNNNNNNKRNV